MNSNGTDEQHPGIVVVGTATGSDETIDELLAAGLAHVRRSRLEPGCLSHDVHRHVEHPNRLVFVERWVDRAALDAHFVQPGSADLLEAVGRLTVEPPTLDIYVVDR